jgi:phage replication O-like protein O
MPNGNPQKENGYTPIANELMEALARTKLNTQESRILFAILRKTYGWNKSNDWISNSQLEQITGIHRSHCANTVTRLITRKIVTRLGNKIKLNKIYNSWLGMLPKRVMLPKQVTSVTQTGNWVLPKQVHTKDTNTKDTKQKREGASQNFLLFFKAYPNKDNKQTAMLALEKVDVDVSVLLAAIERQKKTPAWQDDNGKYIPQAANWLNNRRWEDGGITDVPISDEFYEKEMDKLGYMDFYWKYGKKLTEKYYNPNL